jgi:hypothetical protein
MSTSRMSSAASAAISRSSRTAPGERLENSGLKAVNPAREHALAAKAEIDGENRVVGSQDRHAAAAAGGELRGEPLDQLAGMRGRERVALAGAPILRGLPEDQLRDRRLVVRRSRSAGRDGRGRARGSGSPSS